MKKYYGINIETRTRADGIVYYTGRFRVIDADGTEAHKRVGGRDCLSEKEVYRLYTEFMKHYEPPKKREKKSASPLVADMVNTYLAYCKPINTVSTIYEKRSVFNRHILPYFTTMADITENSCRAWQDRFMASCQSYNLFKKARVVFHTFLEWYTERQNTQNPFLHIKPPRNITPKKEMKIWEEATFLKFIAVVDNPVLRMLFILLFYTGVRVGEALALKETDIKDGYITINKTIVRKVDGCAYAIKPTTKNNKVRRNKLLSVVQTELKTYLSWKRKNKIPPDLLFGGGYALSENYYQRGMTRYCLLASVPKIRIHDFRHSYVSSLIYYGASIPLVASLIGDTIEQVMRTYSHLCESERDNITKTLEKHCTQYCPQFDKTTTYSVD